MKWCPLLACAASDALESRGWNNVKKFIDGDIVLALLSAAEETPVDGEESMPSLLQMSFIVHDTIRRLNTEAPLVDVDTKSPLQTGLIVLGESRGQQLDQIARQLATNAAIKFATDVIAAGEASLKQPPEHVPSLETVTAGGRELTALERSLVGRWIWQDFYTSGSFLGDESNCTCSFCRTVIAFARAARSLPQRSTTTPVIGRVSLMPSRVCLPKTGVSGARPAHYWHSRWMMGRPTNTDTMSRAQK